MDIHFPFDSYFSFLKQNLSPARYQHSLGVMRVMGELAEIYHLNRKKALVAGLLHDVAKELTPEQMLQSAYAAKLKFTCSAERHPTYLHAVLGAKITYQKFGITDRLILDAIATHSYSGDGENYDTPFCWCLRFADVLAPTNAWFGQKKLTEISYSGQLQTAKLLLSGWIIDFFHGLNIPIHPDLAKTFQKLSEAEKSDNPKI